MTRGKMKRINGHQLHKIITDLGKVQMELIEFGQEHWGDAPTKKKVPVDHQLFGSLRRTLEKLMPLEESHR